MSRYITLRAIVDYTKLDELADRYDIGLPEGYSGQANLRDYVVEAIHEAIDAAGESIDGLLAEAVRRDIAENWGGGDYTVVVETTERVVRQYTFDVHAESADRACDEVGRRIQGGEIGTGYAFERLVSLEDWTIRSVDGE